MKLKHFFILLVLIPNLLFALSETDCKNRFNNAVAARGNAETEYNKSKNCDLNGFDECINFIKKAIKACSNAIDQYDSIIKDIDKSSSKDWKRKLKEECKSKSTEAKNYLIYLKDCLFYVYYNNSINKYKLAENKERDSSQQNLNNSINSLYEAAQLYEEAARYAKEAHDALHTLDIFSVMAGAKDYERDAKRSDVLSNIQTFQSSAARCRTEAANKPAKVFELTQNLRKTIADLKNESATWEQKGLPHNAIEVLIRIKALLEQIASINPSGEAEVKAELEQVEVSIAALQAHAETLRLTAKAPQTNTEGYVAQEQQRRTSFYSSDVLLYPDRFLKELLHNQIRPFVTPIDGQLGSNGHFFLYTGQFTRFLVQNDAPISNLYVTVTQDGEIAYIEPIAIPTFNNPSWDQYLTTDGMVFIPKSNLKQDYGLDLRISIVPDSKSYFSMSISQKCDREGFQFSFSLDGSSTLYDCEYMASPPWQLGALRKPSLPSVNLPSGKSSASSFSPTLSEKSDNSDESLKSYPILDKFIQELKKDPMLIAQYVFNEIAFVDPFQTQQDGVFLAPAIQRNPCTTFLEKQGSPWEQCRLLVYLLQNAGYQAVFAHGEPCSIPKVFAENLLFTQRAGDDDYLLDYPWVLFNDGSNWISLFPWMKEMQIDEGHHLYNLMPDEYASAELWIDKYLKNDPKILKHLGPDGDDTAGVLFVRFVQEELTKQGLSLQDVGVHRTLLKKHFSSWEDFPRATITGETQILESLVGMNHLYSFVEMEIFSHQTPDKKSLPAFHVSQLDSSSIFFRFVPAGLSEHILHIGIFDKEIHMDLNANDTTIGVKVTHYSPILRE